jgi:RNA polymerase subunit RPABC4/transcription elongation factor Spt4
MDICRKCGEKIEKGSDTCPHCGAEIEKGFFATPWIILAIVIYVVMEILAGRTVGPKPEAQDEIKVEQAADSAKNQGN